MFNDSVSLLSVARVCQGGGWAGEDRGCELRRQRSPVPQQWRQQLSDIPGFQRRNSKLEHSRDPTCGPALE